MWCHPLGPGQDRTINTEVQSTDLGPVLPEDRTRDTQGPILVAPAIHHRITEEVAGHTRVAPCPTGVGTPEAG